METTKIGRFKFHDVGGCICRVNDDTEAQLALGVGEEEETDEEVDALSAQESLDAGLTEEEKLQKRTQDFIFIAAARARKGRV